MNQYIYFIPLFFFLNSCDLLKLAYYENELLHEQIPVDEVIQNLPEKLSAKLAYTKKILEYAKASGLKTEHSYTQFIDNRERAVSYTVEAAEPYALKNYMWWYPIVGSVPYKGFFFEDERNVAAENFASEGYDIYKGQVAAFSSLGWFEDPIYASMLKRSNSSLANLLFHELTHRTLWINGQANFNEQLATFIADKLTRSFLLTQNEKELELYEKKEMDHKTFTMWLQDLTKALKELYKQKNTMDLELLKKKKADTFKLFLTEKRPNFLVGDLIGNEPWNNAIVLAYTQYSPDFRTFDSGYKCSKSATVGEFLQKFSDKYEFVEDPYATLVALCEGKS